MRGGISCPDHRGGAGRGRVLVVNVRGGFGSPIIRSRSAPLPSLGRGVYVLFPKKLCLGKKKKNHFLRLLSSPESRLQRTAGNALLGVKLTF